MSHVLIAFVVLLATIYAFAAVTDIERFVVSTVKEVGMKNTAYMMMGALGFVVFFISALWVLYGLGFE